MVYRQCFRPCNPAIPLQIACVQRLSMLNGCLHRLCPFCQLSSILSTHTRPLLFSASAVCTRSLVRDDQVPESVRSVLGEAHQFFKEERVEAGVVIMDNTAPPEKVFFIGAGSVELQVGLCTTAPVGKVVDVMSQAEYGTLTKNLLVFRRPPDSEVATFRLVRNKSVSPYTNGYVLCVLGK